MVLPLFMPSFALLRPEKILSPYAGEQPAMSGVRREYLKKLLDQLGLDGEGTTEDKKYTVETVACVGCCALAPVMTINEEVHGDLTKQKVRKLIQAKGDQNGEK